MATSDQADRFLSWSGGVAHPDSPAGSGGPGSFRAAGGSSPSSSPVLSPDSPAGRFTEWRGALKDKAKADTTKRDAEDAPLSGKAAAAALGSILRIPVPGTGGLAIELSPRGWTPKGGSNSSLFIQYIT